MDIWGVGCVFFEMLSLFPLFPGNNEKDQIHKIHNILGTPPKDILTRFQKCASNIDFNFPNVVGTGITKLIPHVSAECQEIIIKMLAYNSDDRITARQALNSNYFKDLKAEDTKLSIHRDPGTASPDNNGEDSGPDDSVQHQPTKRASKPAVDENAVNAKKKNQQGSKKNPELDADQNNEYEDLAPNNVNNKYERYLAASY